MTCERFLEQLDGLDNQGLPIDMVVHARTCPACSRELERLGRALSCYRLPDATPMVDLVPRVSALLPYVPAPRRSVSMRDWLLVGLLIVISMVMVPMLGDFRALRAVYGPGFTLPVFLTYGVAITLYAGLFIISHLEDFSKRLHEFQENRT
jgi:hypothetical protein